MRKIVFFTNRMTQGGSERVISYLANGLSEHYEVDIVTMTCAPSDYWLEERVRHVPMEEKPARNNHSVLVNFSRFRNLKKYIQENAEATFVSFVTLPSYLMLALRKYAVGKMVVAVRNDPVSTQNSFLDRLLIQILYPKADAFVFQTQAMQAFFEERIAIGNSAILPNPVNEKFIRVPAKHRNKEIVCVGRLIPQKNHKMLIEAFARIAAQFPDYQLIIYGEGYLRNELEQLIQQKGMAGRIILAGSKRDLEMRIYEGALFVLSSDFEGVPNALIEAMALGLPSVATALPGTTALVKDRENGLLVPVNDPAALASAMAEVLSKPEFAEYLGENAHKSIQTLSPKEIIDQWKTFLERI